jgi:hypothetical protein
MLLRYTYDAHVHQPQLKPPFTQSGIVYETNTNLYRNPLPRVGEARLEYHPPVDTPRNSRFENLQHSLTHSNQSHYDQRFSLTRAVRPPELDIHAFRSML